MLQNTQPTQPDRETELIACLTDSASRAGICFDRSAIVNFYIALKSKPLVILTGPEKSGKIALVQCLARSLMGTDCQQCQMMTGHPWSFEKSANIALVAEAQIRLNTDKFLCLLEEAWQPENTRRVFIACITRISPAELLSFFTEVAFQLRHGQLMRFGDIHFSVPLPFPPNLFLIGTMDTQYFDWWDGDLLSEATIISEPTVSLLPSSNPRKSFTSWECEFLQSSLRNRQAVYHKIHAILGCQRQPLRPLLQIEALLGTHATLYSGSLVDEAMVYLGNSWSRLGNGLFDRSNSGNLRTALDLAIAQILLPHSVDPLRDNATLRERLLDIMSDQFPRSAMFVSALA